MDDKTIKKLWDRARLKGSLILGSDKGEDFAQEVMLAYLSGKANHQSVSFAVIDAIRKLHGRTGPEVQKVRTAAELSYCELDSRDGAEPPSSFINIDFDKLIKKLPKIERAAFVLRFVWGLEVNEIGYCFGFSESRASQVVTSAQKAVRALASRKRRIGR